MLTRRKVLLGAIAAGMTMRTRMVFAKASQPSTPVDFEVPAGACDCHTHIHGDPEKFPFFSGRVYTPEVALPEEMAALHKALHIQRVVIVWKCLKSLRFFASGRMNHFLVTRATPMTASSMPAMPTMLNASLNMTHAITAVVGGVRYNKLVTCVAALLRMSANSRKIAPIDRARTDHSKAPTKRGVHCTASSAGVIPSIVIANGNSDMGSTCFSIIGYSLSFSGTADTQVDVTGCKGYTPYATLSIVRLVE